MITTEYLHYYRKNIVPFDDTLSKCQKPLQYCYFYIVCPYSGVYLFSISVYANDNVGLYLEIMHNNQVVMDLYLCDEPVDSNSGDVLIINLEVGDIILVKFD